MKVSEILLEEGPGWNISPQDMEHVYKVLSSKPELHVRDVASVAEEVLNDTDFSRNLGSAKFIIQRMHVIMHGIAPHGVSERTAEQWMTPAKPLLFFMHTKGYEPEEQIKRARIELRGRKPSISQDQATQMMADYAKSQLDNKQRSALRPQRNDIVADIMTGLSPDEAFGRRLQ